MFRLFLIAGLCFFFSCRKDKATDAPKPQVIINTPIAGQHYVKGDTIRITGTASHSADLLEVAVHMTSSATGSEFFHNHFVPGNVRQYDFSSVYGIPDLVKATYKVEVEASDKEGNTTVKEIEISVN